MLLMLTAIGGTPMADTYAEKVWFHGGTSGKSVGDILTPHPPHITDGCPVCVARARGVTLSVGVYRRWLTTFGDRARPALDALAGAPDDAPVDPPSAESGVFLTTHEGYAAWFAARSGNGDLYEVVPIGQIRPSHADHFPSVIADAARIVRVVRREVRLLRAERRTLNREWAARDRSRRKGEGGMTDTSAENEKVVREGLHIGDCGVWVISDPQPCDCGGDYPERALDAMTAEYRRVVDQLDETRRGWQEQTADFDDEEAVRECRRRGPHVHQTGPISIVRHY